MTQLKLFMLLFDLYWLRYEKPGGQWYELTDYLRECLVKDGYKISYDDKNKELRVNGKDLRWILIKRGIDIKK